MEDKKSMEMVKHVFTEEEKRDFATEMALKVAEMQSLEDQKKAVASQFKSDIEALQAKVNRFAYNLNSGSEMRSVECRIEYDTEHKEATYYRIDTGEFIKTRLMNQQELQISLEEYEAKNSNLKT